MNTLLESAVRMAAKQLASDAEICRICRIKPERLDKYRGLIDAARAETMVSLKMDRARGKARQAPKDGNV